MNAGPLGPGTQSTTLKPKEGSDRYIGRQETAIPDDPEPDNGAVLEPEVGVPALPDSTQWNEASVSPSHLAKPDEGWVSRKNEPWRSWLGLLLAMHTNPPMAKPPRPSSAGDFSEESGSMHIDRESIAMVLSRGGVALIGVFLARVLISAFKVQPLEPGWLNVCVELLGAGSKALLGCAFCLIAPLFFSESKQPAMWAGLLRRLSLWVAIGYLIIIPIQIFDGYRMQAEDIYRNKQELARLQSLLKGIENAGTASQLRAAWEKLPGSFLLPLPEKIDEPIVALRDQLIKFVKPRMKRTETQNEEKHSQDWQRWSGFWFKNTLQALLLFIGFSAIGQSSRNRFTLFEAIFERRKVNSPIYRSKL